MSALAQISVEQAKPLSHLLMRSFLCLNNPALRKLLWTASLRALGCTPHFCLCTSLDSRNAEGVRDVSRCCSFAWLSGAFTSAPQARGPANTLLSHPGADCFLSLAQHQNGSNSLSDLCHRCHSLLLLCLPRLLPPQGFTFGTGFLVLRRL